MISAGLSGICGDSSFTMLSGGGSSNSNVSGARLSGAAGGGCAACDVTFLGLKSGPCLTLPSWLIKALLSHFPHLFYFWRGGL
jgi:hypothetical protein